MFFKGIAIFFILLRRCGNWTNKITEGNPILLLGHPHPGFPIFASPFTNGNFSPKAKHRHRWKTQRIPRRLQAIVRECLKICAGINFLYSRANQVDNACCSQPTRHKLRLCYAWLFATSIVDYNFAAPCKRRKGIRDKGGLTEGCCLQLVNKKPPDCFSRVTGAFATFSRDEK